MTEREPTRAAGSFRWTLGQRLNLLLLAIAPLPLAALFLLSTYQYESGLRHEFDLRLAARAKDSGLEVYRRLGDLEADLRLAAREKASASNLNLTAEPWSDRFRRLLWLPSGESPAGVAPVTAGAGGSWEDRQRNGEATLVEARSAAAPPALWLVVPGARPEDGALWGQIELGWLWTTGAFPAEGGVRWQLHGGAGTAALSSVPSPAPELERGVAALNHQGIGGVDWRDPEGVRWRARFSTIPVGHAYGHAGLVVAVSEIDRVGAEAALLRRSSWLVAAGALLLSAIVIRRRLRSQLRPLTDLLDATGRLATGDLSARAAVGGAADLEQLGQAFNGMAEELERGFHLLEAGNEVANAALDAAPDAERVAAAFVENVAPVAPKSLEMVLVLSDRRGRTSVIRRGQASEKSEGSGAPELALAVPERIAEVQGWVEVESGLAAPIGGAVDLPSIWRTIRRGDRTFGALGLLGYSGSAAERRFLEALEGPSVQLGLAFSRVRLIDELDRANWGTLTALARAVDAKSSWTRGHSERVTGISVAIGEQLGLSAAEIRTLRRGALLHDVGKIGVPSAVLDKEERLTLEEIEMLRSHVEKGVRIIEPMEGFSDALPIVAQHHERLDGSGYPYGLVGAEIHPLAALVAVADVFEALSAARPYRTARVPEFGMKVLREGAGVAFDPVCVEALERARFDSERWPYPELAPTDARATTSGRAVGALDATWSGVENRVGEVEIDLPPSLMERL
jgi:putative nucleotidyltransferase with HDIG domain